MKKYSLNFIKTSNIRVLIDINGLKSAGNSEIAVLRLGEGSDWLDLFLSLHKSTEKHAFKQFYEDYSHFDWHIQKNVY